jgi:hypothetical protein
MMSERRDSSIEIPDQSIRSFILSRSHGERINASCGETRFRLRSVAAAPAAIPAAAVAASAVGGIRISAAVAGSGPAARRRSARQRGDDGDQRYGDNNPDNGARNISHDNLLGRFFKLGPPCFNSMTIRDPFAAVESALASLIFWGGR